MSILIGSWILANSDVTRAFHEPQRWRNPLPEHRIQASLQPARGGPTMGFIQLSLPSLFQFSLSIARVDGLGSNDIALTLLKLVVPNSPVLDCRSTERSCWKGSTQYN